MIDSIICMGANAFRIYLTSRCMNAFFRTEEGSERKMILAFGAFLCGQYIFISDI